MCGENVNKTNNSVSLDDEIDLNVTFKDMIEYYCRIKLDDKSSLSQKVCFGCKSIIENFIKFCDMTDNVQSKLKNDISFQRNCIDIKCENSIIDEDSAIQHSFKETKKEDPVLTSVIKRKRGRVITLTES